MDFLERKWLRKLVCLSEKERSSTDETMQGPYETELVDLLSFVLKFGFLYPTSLCVRLDY